MQVHHMCHAKNNSINRQQHMSLSAVPKHRYQNDIIYRFLAYEIAAQTVSKYTCTLAAQSANTQFVPVY